MANAQGEELCNIDYQCKKPSLSLFFFHSDTSEVFCQFFQTNQRIVKLELQSLDGEKTVFVTLQTICEWEK